MEKLKRLLEAEHSKKQKDLITKEILAGNIPISEIVAILKSNDGILAQRGAYVITGLHDDNLDHLKPFLSDLWASILPKSHQAIPRAVYRYFAEIDLPEDLEGEVFEIGSQTFKSKKTPIAIKVHIMNILTNVGVKYPEIKDEVAFLIKEQLAESSLGYRSRAKKELKRLGIKL